MSVTERERDRDRERKGSYKKTEIGRKKLKEVYNEIMIHLSRRRKEFKNDIKPSIIYIIYDKHQQGLKRL